MFNRPHIAAAILAASTLLIPASAFADGEIQITHAKANAGDITPGDAPGYPVTISIPGSFQLASNLFVAANKIGIQVTSNEVTIDLNGFKLEGSDVAWYGITGGVDSVTIANGTIARFKFDGINGGFSKYWIVDNVRSIENGRDGMVIGNLALIRSSVVALNAHDGILTQNSAVIEGNTVTGNGRYGIFTARSTVVGNTINSNGDYGLRGQDSTGYSGNTLLLNDGGGADAEVVGAVAQHPNACPPALCPP